MTAHEHFMARALHLAERGLFTTDPNPRVGCVIVKDGEVVGEGWHQRAGQAHAEVNALRQGGDKVKGADCYVTLEPCSHFGRTPPCADALIQAGVKRVFIAMADPNPVVSGNGINKLKDAGITVTVGLLEQQAASLNPGFCQRMRTGRPYVRSKIAMSLDGRTAMASGESQWITGADARQDVQKLRARSSAILTGIGTVLMDDPALTVRPEGDWYPDNDVIRQPLRVVVDSQLQIPAQARVFNNDNKLLIASTVIDSQSNLPMEVLTLPALDDQVDLNALMKALAQREINEVMVEAGAVLNGALLSAGLIDELVFYMAPKLMGNAAKGVFHLPELHTLAENIDLKITDMRSVGRDWRITALPEYTKDI
ncbi:MAG: bifunctional diaminohydroxyphosphoribosylaminopyrimidine deaminase/5-amino-6-(5-phosphoribosylamino)uracil reductase RibD [Gammaproteobacteria bacterium]|nr:bifunctional diaminohydroxyphosphoribosylaminopyrimidine deaminase/5-amino-6-(5-phosphoribosylamino)uracil reductase RibD [Gammaproteobacteria bacterium]MDH5591839.1 bifunctional diaminohydroxyphosphoribosylaminopyrimidine deaminase/5-amino-6-(5-phosphoribosylamino)uracil reductase RibD [Gammaproteobacteria bacterium]